VLKTLGAAFAACVVLAACGGGGGNGYTPSGNPPSTQTSPGASPTPTPTPTPVPTSTASVTFSGTVTQLSGPLAHDGVIPASPMPAPVPGAPIAGANVYVTTATGVLTNGTPSPILAQATTAPDGTFTTPSLPVSAFNGGKAGIVVLNGTSVSSANGLTDKGFAVLHTQAQPNQGNVIVPNLEIDSLSADESAGAPEIERVRANQGLAPTAVDEATLESVRWSAQNDATAPQCGIVMSPLDALYVTLGGVGSPSAAGDSGNASLSAAIDAMYQTPSTSEVWGAAAESAAGCYQILTLNAGTVF
jgi:hypothetical protein